VVLVKDEATAQDKIGFEFVDGPVTPKPEKLPGTRKRTPPRKPKPNGPGGSGNGPGGSGSKGPASRGPLVKA
jgi:ATP-dependent Clp protease ATP-binding subunit ClpA